MRDRLKTIFYSIILSGIFVFVIGVYFAVIKAGLPYQDPTTEMTIRWMAYNTAGEACALFGIVIFLVGFVGWFVHKFVKRKAIGEPLIINPYLLPDMLPVLSPEFYTVKDNSGNELVFLSFGNEHLESLGGITDKTQCEAVENHVHLFEKISSKEKDSVIKFGTAIANNLLRALQCAFPDKKFIVYLSVNETDSTIVRFHQIWDNEQIYYDVTQFKQDRLHLFEFRS